MRSRAWACMEVREHGRDKREQSRSHMLLSEPEPMEPLHHDCDKDMKNSREEKRKKKKKKRNRCSMISTGTDLHHGFATETIDQQWRPLGPARRHRQAMASHPPTPIAKRKQFTGGGQHPVVWGGVFEGTDDRDRKFFVREPASPT